LNSRSVMTQPTPQPYGQCEVWWAGPEAARPAHLALLDATELDRRERLRDPVDRARFTVAAALLRLVVSRHTGDDPTAVTVDRTCDDCGQMHGKPRVRGSGLGLSISHSGGRVAVACGRGVEVGIDVEKLSRQPDSAALVHDVLTDREAAHVDAIGGTDPSHALLTYWTRKEAVLKTTGDGLRVPMTSIAVSPPLQWPRLEAYASRAELIGRLQMWPLHPGRGYVAAIGVLPTRAPVASSGSSDAVKELDGAVLLDHVG
jgi:4'-phosphopantetheinyl transferase